MKKILFIILSVFLLNNSVYAATGIVRPNENNNMLWTTYAYTNIDDPVEEPAAGYGDTVWADQVDNLEKQQYDMGSLAGVDSVSQIVLHTRMAGFRGDVDCNIYIAEAWQTATNIYPGDSEILAWQPTITWTGAWTQADLDGLLLGFTAHTSGTPDYIEIDVAYCEVTYTPVPPPSPPTVTTQAASSITTTSAVGNGNITATGGANATTRGFKYSQGASCTDANTVSENGSFGTGAYQLTMSPLSPNVQYSYRAFATNSAGTGYGGCVQFTTLSSAPPSQIIIVD
jgi:hypothetical protein